ncbi:flagellar hook-length control protein FliK, partial [Niallia sp. NCCP-28]|uniref:flagellar hook-length control protein FliK n=1 Tax=Niallia sp. NCCP-28 TaxID=2934712 RepID=UPI0020C006BD
DERTFMSEGTGHPIEEILKFSQDTSQLAQQNKEYADGLGKIRRDQSVRTMEAHAEMKNLSNANESAHRITPLFEQLQQVTEGKAFNRFRSQFANTNFASQAANSEKNSNKTTLLQETPTSSSGIIRQTNGMNITENTEQELPIHAGTKINEAASLQPNLQSNQKEAMSLNQTMALDTVQLINPLLYQTSSQMAERRANEHNKDAVMANGSQARANAIIDEAAINSGQIMHSGQSINPFHYKTFVGRADTQLKISSQAVKPAEAATEGEETPFQLNNIKSLVSSIVDKLNTAAKKEEKPNAMFAKMVNPLMIGSIKKTNDVESVRMESIKPLVEKNETDAKTIVVGQMQTAISAKQEPLVLLTASGNPVSAHQLREQLEKVLSNGKFVNNGDNQTFTLRLAPDHLGSIKIEIYQKEGNISAKIFTASQEAKDVLETHLTSIKHTLGSQNAVVDKLDISYTPSPQDKTAKDNQQHQQQQQEQQQKEEQPSQQKEREKQRKTFLEELLNME